MDLEPRRCFREPVPEILKAASLLSDAVSAHLSGDRRAATKLFGAADMPVIREWTESILGKHQPDILRVRPVADAPPILPKEQRVPVRMPSRQDQAALIERFGRHCAFCGIPLIRKQVRIRAVKLYPEAVTWGRTNSTQHAAFQAMWLQFDHVLPHARGGDNSIENCVITCAPCNFGRMSRTLAEVGLIDPRSRPVIRREWDGLERLR
jgi:hypothetical protein